MNRCQVINDLGKQCPYDGVKTVLVKVNLDGESRLESIVICESHLDQLRIIKLSE